jgi:hypothetical protein
VDVTPSYSPRLIYFRYGGVLIGWYFIYTAVNLGQMKWGFFAAN